MLNKVYKIISYICHTKLSTSKAILLCSGSIVKNSKKEIRLEIRHTLTLTRNESIQSRDNCILPLIFKKKLNSCF